MAQANVETPAVAIVNPTAPAQAQKKSAEAQFNDLTKELDRVRSDELRALLDRQNDLIERLNELANIADVERAERERAIIESNLASTREQIAKRTENVGVMAAALMALYDELGLQAQKADEESPEDDAKRADAQQKVEDAIAQIAALNAAVQTAEAAVTETEKAWWPIGKKAKVDAAKKLVEEAKARVPVAEKRLAEARENILIVEQQIEVDKADRIRRSSLAANFARIRQFTQNAVTTLKDDVVQTEARRAVTKKALESALVRKAESARDLDALRDQITRDERDLERETRVLNEIPDQGSEAYAKQHQLVTQLNNELVEKRGAELMLNTKLMSLMAAVEANSSSLNGLTVQRDTANVYTVKLETAERTAEILGHNIDRMIKNTTQETASDALDRAADKMIVTSIELGVQAEVASARAANEALQRHEAFMQQIALIRDAGDEAIAGEAQRYHEIDKRVRAGYAERGIDVDMGHLLEAAKTVGQPRRAAADTTDVVY